MTTTEIYLAVIAFVLFAALVISAALGSIDARDADNLAAENRRLQRQLAAATDQLLADLDNLSPKDFLR